MTNPAPASTPPAYRSKTPLIIGGVIMLLVVAGLLYYFLIFSSPERKLIGTWKEKPSTMMMHGIAAMQMTFKPDKTYETSVGMTGTWELKDKSIRLSPRNTVSLGGPPMDWKIQTLDSDALKVDVGGGVTIEFTR